MVASPTASGYVADFRHTIIILTTNLGATTHRTSGLGFGTAAADTFSSEQIMRAVGQTYRPEFQNRLDKVIVFHPLTRDLMRGILRKELDLVLQRRGLKDRVWAVEWEASAQDFLLEKGFSPEMGARPLKRAIDQYVHRSARRHHRREALSRGRPVRIRAQRRPRHPGRVRRSRQRSDFGWRLGQPCIRRAARIARDDAGAWRHR